MKIRLYDTFRGTIYGAATLATGERMNWTTPNTPNLQVRLYVHVEDAANYVANSEAIKQAIKDWVAYERHKGRL